MSPTEDYSGKSSKPTAWELHQQQAEQTTDAEKLLRTVTSVATFVFVMGVSAGAGYWWLNGGPDSVREAARRTWDEPFEVELKEGETRKVWLDPEKTAESMRRTLSGG